MRNTRWVTDTGPGHSQWYVNRFRQLAAEGADLAGEARLLDALVPPTSGSSTRAAAPAGSVPSWPSGGTRWSGWTPTRS